MIPFGTEDQATNWAIDWLRSRGFSITRPADAIHAGEKMSPGELRRRVGLKSAAFHKRLYHSRCPIYRAEYGPSMRLLWILATPELLAWLGRPLAPGKKIAEPYGVGAGGGNGKGRDA
jgi:hypothetical protein